MKSEDIRILRGDAEASVRALSEDPRGGAETLADLSRSLIESLNPGFSHSRETAAEWCRYLRLISAGGGDALENPYSDLPGCRIDPVTADDDRLLDSPLIRPLDASGPQGPAESLAATLFIAAVGGSDTTFYEGMGGAETESFLRGFVTDECAACFGSAALRRGIPRAFIGRTDGEGGRVTHLESLLVQAYEAGLRHAVVLTNASLAPAVERFLAVRIGGLRDLKWVVAVQPLLPAPVFDPGRGAWTVSGDEPGYPGGHGHGFKYALRHETVGTWIRERGLCTFLFSNGDNASLFQRGAEPFVRGIGELERLRNTPGFETIGIALYLVWESAQKGGFAFFVRPGCGEPQVRIVEMELARAAGLDSGALRNARCGYNSNVAVGFLDLALRRMDRLPMALKRKRIEGRDRLLLEASFATALTTTQDAGGASRFEPRSAMVLLPPGDAAYPHWIHASIRKREDWLAYASSIFRCRRVDTAFGPFTAALNNRPAGRPLPRLAGDMASPDVLTTGRFFEIFRDAEMDLADFDGTLRVDLPAAGEAERGRLKFEGKVRFEGNGLVAFTVPPGERWVIRDRTFASPADIRSVPG
jgi:hypothetical protein